ncbi:hypothetical protein Asp14428_39750 [Actinoplanes sp. NBRC 14428]|nr:hypothetical protein Asp14428_39750 [Actinoplanes sp. NBRC 14428]
MSLIDLDRPATVRSKPPRRRAGTVAAGVALLAVGALLGSAATSVWIRSKADRARESEVSVVVLADTGPEANDAGVGGVVTGGRVVNASLTRGITLVNAGPLPVNVHRMSFVRDGLSVRSDEKQRWIGPGRSVHADADIRVRCAGGLPIGRLSVELAVRTNDEQERTTVAVLDGTRWNDQVKAACDGALL